MDVFKRLGLRRVINAVGPETVMGGSVLDPQVVEAMNEIAGSFVTMDELHERAGEIIAEIVGAEAAFVTSGCAAALVLATAACITGKDPAKMAQLPNTEGLKNEVIIQRGHRNPFDSAYRAAGAKFVEVGSPYARASREIEAAIGEKTAAITYVVMWGDVGKLSIDEVLKVAKSHDIPMIVDGAWLIPPLESFRRVTSLGVDLIASSGGKLIRGPNDTGFVCGRSDLVEACRMQGCPNFGIGRPMKVSKEQIVGLVAAMELYAKKDHQTEQRIWESILKYVMEQLVDVPHIDTMMVVPDDLPPGLFLPLPLLLITLNEETLGKTVWDVIEALKAGDPSIYTIEYITENYFPHTIVLNPTTIIEGQEYALAESLKEALKPKK